MLLLVVSILFQTFSSAINFLICLSIQKSTCTALVVPSCGNKGDAIYILVQKTGTALSVSELHLQQDLTFSVLEGLKGKFKGIKPGKPRKPLAKGGPMKKKTNTKLRKRRRKPQLSVIRASTKMWLWVIPCLSLRRKSRTKSGRRVIKLRDLKA